VSSDAREEHGMGGEREQRVAGEREQRAAPKWRLASGRQRNLQRQLKYERDWMWPKVAEATYSSGLKHI
jgi:hypothetical protein